MKIRTKLFSLFALLYIVPFVTNIIMGFLGKYIPAGSELSSLVSLILQFFIPLVFVVPLVFIMSKRITEPLKILTDSANNIAHGDLDDRVDIDTDDEFGDLAETFNEMADSLQRHTQTLANSLVELKEETERANEATEEVAMSAQYMDCATNEAQQLVDRIITEKDFSLRFNNRDMVKCWEQKDCKNSTCPAYENNDQRCWHITGVACNEGQVSFAEKFERCTKCKVYREATSNRLSQIGESFNHIIALLEAENKKSLSAGTVEDNVE